MLAASIGTGYWWALNQLPETKTLEQRPLAKAPVDPNYVPQYEFASHIPGISVSATPNATQLVNSWLKAYGYSEPVQFGAWLPGGYQKLQPEVVVFGFYPLSALTLVDQKDLLFKLTTGDQLLGGSLHRDRDGDLEYKIYIEDAILAASKQEIPSILTNHLIRALFTGLTTQVSAEKASQIWLEALGKKTWVVQVNETQSGKWIFDRLARNTFIGLVSQVYAGCFGVVECGEQKTTLACDDDTECKDEGDYWTDDPKDDHDQCRSSGGTCKSRNDCFIFDCGFCGADDSVICDSFGSSAACSAATCSLPPPGCTYGGCSWWDGIGPSPTPKPGGGAPPTYNPKMYPQLRVLVDTDNDGRVDSQLYTPEGPICSSSPYPQVWGPAFNYNIQMIPNDCGGEDYEDHSKIFHTACTGQIGANGPGDYYQWTSAMCPIDGNGNIRDYYFDLNWTTELLKKDYEVIGYGGTGNCSQLLSNPWNMRCKDGGSICGADYCPVDEIHVRPKYAACTSSADATALSRGKSTEVRATSTGASALRMHNAPFASYQTGGSWQALAPETADANLTGTFSCPNDVTKLGDYYLICGAKESSGNNYCTGNPWCQWNPDGYPTGTNDPLTCEPPYRARDCVDMGQAIGGSGNDVASVKCNCESFTDVALSNDGISWCDSYAKYTVGETGCQTDTEAIKVRLDGDIKINGLEATGAYLIEKDFSQTCSDLTNPADWNGAEYVSLNGNDVVDFNLSGGVGGHKVCVKYVAGSGATEGNVMCGGIIEWVEDVPETELYMISGMV